MIRAPDQPLRVFVSSTIGERGELAEERRTVERAIRRAGRRTWPFLRRGEDEVVARVRGAVGATRFEEVFATGSRLTLREAVAAVRDQRSPATTAP